MTDPGGSGAGSTVENEVLVDPYRGLPASLSVLQNDLNKCGLPREVWSPLARQIAEIRDGVLNLQQTLLRERKADMWVTDAWVSRADLEAARAEIEQRVEDLAITERDLTQTRAQLSDVQDECIRLGDQVLHMRAVEQAVRVLFGRRGAAHGFIHHERCKARDGVSDCDCGAQEIRNALQALDALPK